VLDDESDTLNATCGKVWRSELIVTQFMPLKFCGLQIAVYQTPFPFGRNSGTETIHRHTRGGIYNRHSCNPYSLIHMHKYTFTIFYVLFILFYVLQLYNRERPELFQLSLVNPVAIRKHAF